MVPIPSFTTTYSSLLMTRPAGIPIEKCSGTNTAVYTGCFTNDYQSVLQEDFELEATHAAMGIAFSMLAHRVSWFFNFKGVSMNLDSACSSSLVALHLAAQDLAAGNSSMVCVRAFMCRDWSIKSSYAQLNFP